jgi:SnoaL-like domain
VLRYFFLAVAVLAVCLLGALGGWALRGRMHAAPTEELQSFSVLEKGDASATVRAEVLKAVRLFQDGYARRDPTQLEAFMQGLFPRDEPVVLMGTDSNEWVGGYGAVSRFIRKDWLFWGDVRLEVEDSAISSHGDVAWLATTGRVGSGSSSRHIRFGAVLTRHKTGWMFRQVHFQWVDRGDSLSEPLSPRILLGFLRRTLSTNRASAPDK